MKATLLLRTGSGSPTIYPSHQDSGAGTPFSGENSTPSPRSVLHFHAKTNCQISSSFRRSVSDSDLIRSEISYFTNRNSFRSSPARISEEEDLQEEQRIDEKSKGSSSILKRNGLDLCVSGRAGEILPEHEVLVEELEFSGGGIGKGEKAGGGNGGGRGGAGSGSFDGGNADQNKIGAYYQQMLKADPGNPLLLRNYGKFLHEVEKDYVGAEEYYGRAILASPGDGDVLSLYGKLVWESQRDQGKAQGYFDQAIKASPDDCYVLGSYAHFLWDAEDDEEGEEDEAAAKNENPALVEAH